MHSLVGSGVLPGMGKNSRRKQHLTKASMTRWKKTVELQVNSCYINNFY